MDEDNMCPNATCVACATSAITAQEFRLFVRNAQSTWHKAIKAINSVPMTNDPSVKSLCTFIKSDNLQSHTVKDYLGGDSRLILKRLQHYRLTRQKSNERKQKTPRMGPSCNCPDCGKAFYSPHFLRLHLRNSGYKEACSHCGLVLFRGQEIKEHLEKAHGESTVMCKQCPLLFPDEVLLKKHEKKAHKTNNNTCSDCGRSFPGKSSFEVHLQMHAVWTCRACGMQFTNRSCYREHRNKCDPSLCPDTKSLPRNKRANIRYPSIFTCDYCGKTYLSRPQLKNHIIWIHMDIRPHQCQWCGKRFFTPARLAEHSVVHTRERKYACDICGAKLVTKMAVVYHRRRHTGEKPYKCEDCDESFISASRRTDHAKRKHGKGVMIHCSLCSARFVRSLELKKHMEKLHSKKGGVEVAIKVE